MIISVLTAYLGAGLVLLCGGLVFAACVRWQGRRLTAGGGDGFLRWGWLTLVLAVALPAGLIGGGVSPLRRPALEIWSGPAAPAGPLPAASDRVSLRLSQGRTARPPALSLGSDGLALGLALFGAGILLGGARLLLSQRRLRRFCVGLPVVKRVGRVVLAAGPEGVGPFAARVGGRAYVVIPLSVLEHPRRLAMILAHEAHHLRRGHLLAARWLAGLQLFYFWNPGLGLWRRALAELEDLACDRAVLARWRDAAGEYARCLLWAAARACGQAPRAALTPGTPAGATVRWMAAAARGPLARRMRMLNDENSTGGGRTPTPRARARMLVLAGASLTVVVGAALGVHAAVGTPRVSAEQVAAIGARIVARSGFPVIADARIAEALNRRLLQPTWREATRAGLQRMPAHRATIEESLRQAGLPVELLAMVMAESAFNPEARTSRPPPKQSVGIWQIMPGTGRKLGLTVSPEQDDRLDPRKASDAAARYLVSLHQRFGDWAVAISAYNAGEQLMERFQAGATPAETRDRLLASQAEYGRYLVSVMISMLIIEEPSLLD